MGRRIRYFFIVAIALILVGLIWFAGRQKADLIKGKVLGTGEKEKSELAVSSDVSTNIPLQKATPSSSPTSTPTPAKNPTVAVPTTAPGPAALQNPTVVPENNRNIAELVKLADFDSLVPYTGSGQINLSQGSISFTVFGDWDEGDRTLILANFNGEDSKNLFEITVGGNLVSFETYDNTGENGKESKSSSFDESLQGKTNEIKVSWNFTLSPKVKRIYIDGKLVQEMFLENVPSEQNSKILIGNIQDMAISDKWE